MINKAVIFRKSSAGIDEIAKSTAERSLPKGLRSILIMVDGKTNYAEYEKTLSGSKIVQTYGSVSECFGQLVALGVVETSRAKRARAPIAKSNRKIEHRFKQKEAGFSDLVIDYHRSKLISCLETENTGRMAEMREPLELIRSASSFPELTSAIQRIAKKHQSSLSNDGKQTLMNTYKKLSERSQARISQARQAANSI